jgi:hypothetical protein
MLQTRPRRATGHVELLAPLADDSNISKFIARRAPACIIAFAAKDIDTVMQRCRDRDATS